MVIDIYTERMAHDNTTVIMADSEDVLFEVIWFWRVEDNQVHYIFIYRAPRRVRTYRSE